MQPAARALAAIEILDDVANRHRPAALALSDWGRSHRFAGSGDRAAIGNLVYDALRQRASIAWRMGDDAPRALALGALRMGWGLSPGEIAVLCDGARHAPAPLTEAEAGALQSAPDPDAPPWAQGDFPEWLTSSFAAAFGQRAVAEGQALAKRPPVDLRVNTLKADLEKVLRALKRFGAERARWSPVGVRIPPRGKDARAPHVEAETGHGRGWFEVQDEGSQLTALLAGVEPRMQVADICAGAGGKTLAFAAAMQNTGQIYAYDDDPHRLRPIFERLKRAGARNVQVLPGGEIEALHQLRERMDIVFADAPCSGSGAWRRRPDSKWRLTPNALADRIKEQRQALELARPLVKPGGSLIYVTCSVLPEENSAQAAWFTGQYPDFALTAHGGVWRERLGTEPPPSADGGGGALLLTPFSHATDGFFVAIMKRIR